MLDNLSDSLSDTFLSLRDFVVVTFGLHFISYWGASLMYFLADKFKWFQDYKIESENCKYDLDTVINVVCNQLTIPIICVLIYPILNIDYHLHSTLYPFLVELLKFLTISLLMEDIGFYYTHRILHSYFYEIHKVHHEYVYPVAYSALYCHPLEFIFSNLLPLVSGPIIVSWILDGPLSVYIFWLWILSGTLNTLHVHSGYDFSNSKYYPPHYYHHIAFNKNYGLLGLMDYLNGTLCYKERNVKE